MMPRSFRCLYLHATGGLLTILLVASPVASAQQPNTSAAALGLDGNFMARARGYEAVAWNPANLGLPGNPRFSLTLLPVAASLTLAPVTLGDIKDVQDYKPPQVVPRATRQAWLDKVTAAGGEKGTPFGGASVALSAGPVAVELGATFFGFVDLNPDAIEALLFGNVPTSGSGPNGTDVRNLSFKDSKLDAGGVTSLAVSYGRAFGDQKRGGGTLAFGGTIKSLWGAFVAVGKDAGSDIDATGGTISVPSVGTRSFQDCRDDLGQLKSGCTVMPGPGGTSGFGFGADVGVAWTRDKLVLSSAIQNLFNTFKWDESVMSYRPGLAHFDANGDSTNLDEQPYANAPASLKAALANYKFKPAIAMGLGYAWTNDITISTDLRQQMGNEESIVIGPKTSLGAGVEYRGIPHLALRGGADYITGGTAFSFGASLRFGRYELGAAMAAQQGDNKGKSLMVNFFSLR
jgi:hypothetical protein